MEQEWSKDQGTPGAGPGATTGLDGVSTARGSQRRDVFSTGAELLKRRPCYCHEHSQI